MNAGRQKVEAEGVCRVCGTNRKLEAAHTWDRSLGRSKFDNADIIVPLCGPATDSSTCHGQYDTHKLDLLPFLTLSEQLAMVAAAGGIERARKRAIGK